MGIDPTGKAGLEADFGSGLGDKVLVRVFVSEFGLRFYILGQIWGKV